MNQTYLNCPWQGSVMSAEEFAAQVGAGRSTGCGQAAVAQTAVQTGTCGCGTTAAQPVTQTCGCGNSGTSNSQGCSSQANTNQGCSCGCSGNSQNVPMPIAYGQEGVGGFNTGNGAGLPGGLPVGVNNTAAAAAYGTNYPAVCQPLCCTCTPCGNPGGCVPPYPVYPPVIPQPLPVDEGCCCKKSFQSALSLLCNPALSNLLNFDAAAFITHTYIAGLPEAPAPAPQTAITVAAEADDNLGATLAGSLRRITPCNGDLLEISGGLTMVGATAPTGITATQVPICNLVAIAIDLAEPVAVGDITPAAVQAQNLRLIQQILSQTSGSPTTCALAVQNGNCGCNCNCSCGCNNGCAPDDAECCCSNGLMNALARNNLSRRVSLVAGPLQLNGVTLIGNVGSVLMLSNDVDNRIYFVCVNEVEYLF